jgi:hypothetical protein
VFGAAAVHAFAPHAKTAGQTVRPHEINYFAGRQTKLKAQGIKGRAVFPRHLDDAVFLQNGKGVEIRGHTTKTTQPLFGSLAVQFASRYSVRPRVFVGIK